MKPKELPQHDVNWKGYTIDEIRYQRAFTLARLEIEKARIFNATQNIYKGVERQTSTGIVGRLLSSLSYLDYAVIAFKFGRRILNIFGSLRRR